MDGKTEVPIWGLQKYCNDMGCCEYIVSSCNQSACSHNVDFALTFQKMDVDAYLSRISLYNDNIREGVMFRQNRFTISGIRRTYVCSEAIGLVVSLVCNGNTYVIIGERA